jgi:hypothetical protein
VYVLFVLRFKTYDHAYYKTLCFGSLQPGDLDGNPVLLRFVKFQTVSNLMIFIKDNQTGTETTRIDHLTIYGSPLSTTNMSDFKRIAGKKGEAH